MLHGIPDENQRFVFGAREVFLRSYVVSHF